MRDLNFNFNFISKHGDILYSCGVTPNGYDERIIPFTGIKMLVDYNKVKFNFDYTNNFGLPENEYLKIKGNNLRETFLNLVNNIWEFANFRYTTENDIKDLVEMFNLDRYIKELPDDSTLKAILDIYNDISFKDIPKEKFKDLYETTIAKAKKDRGFNGSFTGQYFTQSATVRLICEIAYGKLKADNLNTIKIYDPACGAGMMLIEAFFFFKEKGFDVHVYGQEIDKRVWLLAKIFLEALDIPNTLTRGNTLTETAFAEETFDVILANPPFGINWKHYKNDILKNIKNFYVVTDENNNVILPSQSDGQFLFMLHIAKLLENAKKQGKHAVADVISSASLAYNSGKQESIIRAKLLERFTDSIILQPSNMFSNTSVQTCIWILDSEKADNRIIAVNAANPELHTQHKEPVDHMKNTYSDKQIQEIAELVLLKNNVDRKAKVIEKQKLTGINVASLIPLKSTDCKDVDVYELYMDLMKKLKYLAEAV